MVNSMVYHGLSLNSSNLGTNDYVAFAITGGIEIPAYIMDIFIVEFFGRRLSLFFCLMLGGYCLNIIVATGVALTTVSMIGKFGIAGSFAIIYLYTVELYPTNIRGVAIGSCSMFSRVATISAPLVLILAKYWDPLPLVIYGSLSVIASLSALALPETRGKKLPETLEEGEQFGLNDGEKGETTAETVHDNPAFSMKDEK
ncbi:organic cation transporter protein-like [Strongylocentrotus purpuratus]|uniref:Major facilitator superfamily (MFS) profile domain-containing protein n=1 Tax=Strongylocentrotus purpuratus TaxID=7668 RepID=A0A7M7PGX5_STRPU|nr:organic cation transporter protein-like [Strongylocentrotus purpuratus]